MAGSDDRKTTFRVTNIPGSFDRDSFQEKLTEVFCVNDSTNIHVHSLAYDVFQDQPGSRRMVATVTFNELPEQLQSSSKDTETAQNVDGRLEWPIFLTSGVAVSAIDSQKVFLDTHFNDFTPLSPLENDEKHAVDFIVIPGWGGHAFGSFKERQGHYMWLRDSLARDLPELRVILYGYESKVVNESLIAGVEEWTEKFCELLKVLRHQSCSENQQRPLIFLAHSLGGWIFKGAVTLLSKSSDPKTSSIVDCIYGALFFGVPSQGMDTEALASMIEDKPQRATLNELEERKGHRWREQRHQDFCKAFNFEDSRVIRYYELHLSPTVHFDDSSKRWKQDGPKKLLVSRESAVYGRACDRPEDGRPLEGTHSSMVKFRENDRSNYHAVKFQLQEFVTAAGPVVNARLGQADVKEETHMRASAEESKTLQSLYFPETRLREDEIEEPLPETCQWLMEHTEYSNWLHQGGLLWIEGKPGAGKSTLMQFAVTNARQREAQGQVRVAAFFFHGQGSSLQKTLIGLWRSILHQILTTNQPLRSKLQIIFEENNRSRGRYGDRWQWTVKDLQEFFKLSLQHSPKPIEIYIDALDECGQAPATDLISFLRKSIAPRYKSHLKVCFACRHYPLLRLDEGFHICVEQENSGAIASYVESELGHIGKLKDIRIEISGKSNGLFQWAKLIVQITSELEKTGANLKSIQNKIDGQPASLFGVYRELISTISAEDVPRALLLAQWICFIERPISVQESRCISAFDIDSPYFSLESWKNSEDFVESDISMQRQILLLRGLVEVKMRQDTKTLQFIHQSVRDFFVEGQGLNLLGLSHSESVIAVSECRLSRSCLKFTQFKEMQTISSELEQMERYPEIDPFRLRSRERVADNVEYRKREESLIGYSLFLYSIGNAFSHARKAEAAGYDMSVLTTDLSWPIAHAFNRWAEVYYREDNYGQYRQGRFDCLLCTFCTYGVRKAALQLLIKSGQDRAGRRLCREAIIAASEDGNEAMVKILLEHGADVKSEESAMSSALDTAARNGHESLVKLLIANGADITPRRRLFENPLLSAIRTENETMVQLLIESGADINGNIGPSGSALHYACSKGSEAIVKLLLEKGANINIQGREGLPIHAAVGSLHEPIVKMLIKAGADISSQGPRGCPLSNICRMLRRPQSEAQVAMSRLVIGMGADVNSKGERLGAPLAYATFFGREDLVRFLVENGADVNLKPKGMDSALQNALHRRHGAIAEFLIAEGADINIDGEGLAGSTLHAAAYGGMDSMVRRCLDVGFNLNRKAGYYDYAINAACIGGDEATVRLLIDKGADVNSLSGSAYHTYPLQAAVASGDETIIRLLIVAGADINSQSVEGGTALHVAATHCLPPSYMQSTYTQEMFTSAARQRESIFKLLIESGADVCVQNEMLGTVLHVAASAGSEAIVRLLIRERGMSVNLKGGMHGFAMHAAAYSRRLSIVRLLLEEGADINQLGGKYGYAVHAAAVGHSLPVVRYLTEFGANINVKGGKYAYALHSALAFRCDREVEFEGRTKFESTAISIIRYLVEQGADIDAKDDSGKDVLHFARELGLLLTVQVLEDFHQAKQEKLRNLIVQAKQDALDNSGRIGDSIRRNVQTFSEASVAAISADPEYVMTRNEFQVYDILREYLGDPEPQWSVNAVARYHAAHGESSKPDDLKPDDESGLTPSLGDESQILRKLGMYGSRSIFRE